MNKFIALLLLLNISCATDYQSTNETNGAAQPPVFQTINSDEPYVINVQVNQSEDGENSLVVAVELDDESLFVSPYSSDRFKGRFNISLEDNESLDLDTVFIETPRSVEEYDPHPFIDGLVNWVRVNTTYEHALNVLSEDDFEVNGKIVFVIEPHCTLEQVPFTISSRAGKLKAKLTAKN